MDQCWVTDKGKTPFYLRSAFTLKEAPESATLLACGLGQYNAYLNGQRVGDHFLDPAWTDYHKLVLYNRFDVTELLVAGKNALAMEVGNGWYLWDQEYGYGFHFPPFMPPNPNPYKPYGESLVASFLLTVTYADGSTQTFCSDETCKVKPHGVRHSNVYGSEWIDGAELEPLCSLPEYDDSSWANASTALPEEAPKGVLKEALLPPVKALHRYEGKYLGTVNGRRIYDLGQNMSGILEATVRGKAGVRVDIYPAEKLDAEGDVDQVAKNWMPIDNVITYILAKDDAEETFSQTFTYFAGRYLAVAGEVEVLSLSAQAISSAWKQAGSFICDDERYNRIYDMIEKTVEANMLGVHTDCPTIERFAWQEPNHLMAPSIFYMKDGKALWEKFLWDLHYAQHTAEDVFYDFAGNEIHPGDGLVPSQAPCYIPNVLPVPGMGSFYDIIAWGSTIILGTYWHYLFYGDETVIRDHYDAGMRYLAHLKSMRTPEGFINHGLGDWGNPENALARENIETAFLYADTITLEKFATLLGHADDAQMLHTFAEEVKANYNEKLLRYDENLGVWCYHLLANDAAPTQAAQALPLYWGMVPEEREADVVGAFRMILEEKDALIAGEIGLPYVIQTARRYGMNDLICHFITKTTHPSYYAFICDGETTLGEYWETNPRSHCHDMMGHIIEWYYNGLAGIWPLAPGFAKVRIAPYLPDGMNTFTCTYETPLGTIRIEALRTKKGPAYRALVPEGIVCEAAKDVEVTSSRTE
ncbi:MAG: family 78 glycoside hydrolase catalytic domain [Lachnospiraceae bacterium]|nr:family 78 glycoside hydrolase catalytic domain [Lachnospiraceae bacterium]